jgi:hypothetical protein
VKRLLPLVLLALPILASDLPVSPRTYIPAFGVQSRPAVASNGDTYFAAWDDERGRDGVYGTRLDAGGKPLDPAGIFITDGRHPSVTWNGSAWVVVSTVAGSVEATLIDRGGTIVRRSHVGLLGLAGGTPSVASNGRVTIVALVAGSVFNGPAYAVLDASGIPLVTSRMLPFIPNILNSPPSVISNGSEFLVAWTAPDGVYGVRIGSTGDLLDNVPTLLLPNPLPGIAPALASDGHDYLVAATSAITGNLELRAVAADKTLGAISEQPAARPPVSWNGRTYVLIARSLGQWVVRALDGSGDTPFATIDTATPDFALAGSFVVWTQNGDVVGRSGVIAFSAAPQFSSDIATNGRSFAVAWEELGNAYMALATADGTTGPAMKLNSGTAAVLQTRLAWNGHAYDAAWRDADNKLWANGQAIGCASDELDMASNGDVTLLVWTDCTQTISGIRLRNGQPIDTLSLPISRLVKPDARVTRPRVAWNGSTFVVVWQDVVPFSTVANPIIFYDMHAARVTPELRLVDIVPIAIGTNGGIAPEIASSGLDSLIVYGSDAGVQGRILTNDGIINPAFTIDASHADAWSVTWDGSTYVVAGPTFLEHVSREWEISQRMTIDAQDPHLAAAGANVLLLHDLLEDVWRAYVRSFGAPPRVRPIRM